MMGTGRNDPCPCKSGKKYKRCCAHRDEDARLNTLRREALATLYGGIRNPELADIRTLKSKTPELTLKRLSKIAFSTLRSTYLNRALYASAIRSLRHGDFFNLESGVSGKTKIFSVGVDSYRRSWVKISVTSFDAPLIAHCTCGTYTEKGGRPPYCIHIGFLILTLWAVLHEKYDFDHLLPSITDRLREFELSVHRLFPELSPLKKLEDELHEVSSESVRLVRILYCPPENRLLLDDVDTGKSKLQKWPLEGEELPPVRIPESSEFHPNPRDRRAISSEVPYFIFQSLEPGQFDQFGQYRPYPKKNISQRAEALRNLVQFEFSDHTNLTAAELLFHSYSEKVPKELLPLRFNSLSRAQLGRGIQLVEGIRDEDWGEESEFQKILLTLLVRASQLSQLENKPENNSDSPAPIRVILVSSANRSEKRLFLPLDKIEISDIPSAHWQLLPDEHARKLSPAGEQGSAQAFGRSTLAFTRAKGFDQIQVFRTHELDLEQKILRFHPYLSWISRVGKLMMDARLNHNPEAVSDLSDGVKPYSADRSEYSAYGSGHYPTSLQYTILGHHGIDAFLEEINPLLASQEAPLLTRNPVERVLAENVRPELWLDDQGGLRFSFRFHSERGVVRVWNCPETLNLLLSILNEGVGGATRQKNQWLAQNRRGEKRDRDLKVLKHTGLAAYLFHETVGLLAEPNSLTDNVNAHSQNPKNSVLKTNSSKRELNEKPISVKRERKLFESMGRAISALEEFPQEVGKKQKALDVLCSQGVQNLVSQVISVISDRFEKGSSPVFAPWGKVIVDGVPKRAIQLIHALLKASISENPSLLAKPRSGAFSSFQHSPEAGRVPSDPSTHHNDFFAQFAEDEAKGIRIDPPSEARCYRVVESHRSARKALAALLPLSSQGFELYWEGKPMTSASDKDLVAELRLGVSAQEEIAGEASSQKIDWFELHPRVFFKGVEINRAKLKLLASDGLIEFQGKFYVIEAQGLPSIQRLEEFWSSLQAKEQGLSKDFKNSESHYVLPRHRMLELLALRASGTKVEGGTDWDEICEFYDSLGKKREFDPLPETIRAELKPYQRIGVQWCLDLHRLRLGGILADDMGLGKTIQTLVFLETLRKENRLGRTLIVVPTSLTYNWKSEAAKFTPELPIEVFQPKGRDAVKKTLDETPESKSGFAFIVTYGLFVTHAEFLSQFNWDVLIFDEAQNLKNISAKRTTQARSIEAKFKLCLTGTPLENHLGEFFSLVDLAVPGSLGELSRFRERFVSPELIQPEDVRYLKLKTKPLILRRTKSQILSELPAKTESRLSIPFEPSQQSIYRDIALSWNEKVKGSILAVGERKSQIMMLTALLRLRQVCSDPSGIPGIQYSGEPPKISVLVESLEEITESGESSLVFTQFLHTLHRIAANLVEKKIPHFVIHGGTSRIERERILNEFQNLNTGAVLLMTLKTGGVGLNLVKASYVFHIEPWWNPAVENQATDRAHRIGQTRPVQVFRYIMRESVEEKIERLKERKSARFNALFSETESEESLSHSDSGAEAERGGSFLSRDDFTYLLS